MNWLLQRRPWQKPPGERIDQAEKASSRRQLEALEAKYQALKQRLAALESAGTKENPR